MEAPGDESSPPSDEQLQTDVADDDDIWRTRLKSLSLIIGCAICAGLIIWATAAGYTESVLDSLNELPYILVFLVVVSMLVLISLPCGYGYSIVIIACGYGFGWLGLPPALAGCCVCGPAFAYLINSQVILRNQTAEDLSSAIPHEATKRTVLAILKGIREDRCAILIVAATRPTPLVTGLQNLVLTAARPPFWSVYIPGSILGAAPDAVLLVYSGILIRKAGEKGGWLDLCLIGLQVVACVLLLLLIGFASRRTLSHHDVAPEDASSLKHQEALDQEHTGEDLGTAHCETVTSAKDCNRQREDIEAARVGDDAVSSNVDRCLDEGPLVLPDMLPNMLPNMPDLIPESTRAQSPKRLPPIQAQSP